MNAKFKKITALLLALLTLAALAGCGENEPEETTAATSATTSAQSYLTIGTTELRTVYLTRVPGGSFSEPPASDPGVLGTTLDSQGSGETGEATSSDSEEPPKTQATQSYPIPSQLALSVPPPSTDTLGFTTEELDAFYADSVFVGDSISLGWRNYVTFPSTKWPLRMPPEVYLIPSPSGHCPS